MNKFNLGLFNLAVYSFFVQLNIILELVDFLRALKLTVHADRGSNSLGRVRKLLVKDDREATFVACDMGPWVFMKVLHDSFNIPSFL